MAAPSEARPSSDAPYFALRATQGILRLRCAAAKDGGPDRDQTDDLVVANDALYQLSYWPPWEVTYWKITGCK
jgi:hypothetical protein